jgi:hypothetical protein
MLKHNLRVSLGWAVRGKRNQRDFVPLRRVFFFAVAVFFGRDLADLFFPPAVSFRVDPAKMLSHPSENLTVEPVCTV